MIFECMASFVPNNDPVRLARAKIAVGNKNGQHFILLAFASNITSKEIIPIAQICHIFKSSTKPFVTIKFRLPPKTLTVSIPQSEQQAVHFARTLEGLRRGDKQLFKAVPQMDNFSREITKIQPRALYVEGNNFESKQLTNQNLTKVIFNGTKCLLPKAIWRLNNIIELHLIDCQLEEFPSRLINLKTLNVLNLSKNRIRKIDGRIFTDFKNLKQLDLNHNLISYIPIEIFYLARSLISLDVSYNRLTSLPYTLVYMYGLKTLNVSHNCLRYFPDSILNPSLRKIGMRKLRLDSLDISGNETTYDVQWPLEYLEVLSESYDQYYGRGVRSIPSLKELSAGPLMGKPSNMQLINEWLPRTVYYYLQEGAATCSICKKSCIAYSKKNVLASARYSQISSTVTSDASTNLIPVVQFYCWICTLRTQVPTLLSQMYN